MPCAFARIANGFFRGTQIGGVEISGFVQHLRVSQSDGRSRRRRQTKLHPADHVLSHVKDRIARRGAKHFYRLDFFDFAYGRPGRSNELGFRRIDGVTPFQSLSS